MKIESPGATYSNENDSESTKTNKSSAILDFMSIFQAVVVQVYPIW